MGTRYPMGVTVGVATTLLDEAATAGMGAIGAGIEGATAAGIGADTFTIAIIAGLIRCNSSLAFVHTESSAHSVGGSPEPPTPAANR